MKEIRCTEHVVDDEHNVLIMHRNGLYDCYIMQHIGSVETSFLYMFGLNDKDLDGEQEAVDIAIANAPDYYDLFTDPSVDIGKDIMIQ